MLWDCNYSSFNPGGGECNDCGNKVSGESGCSPSDELLAKIWNRGQKPTAREKLKDKFKAEQLKTRRLRAQLRKAGLDPVS